MTSVTYLPCIQLNVSTTAILKTEESGHCREVAVVNVWTVRQKSGRWGEAVVSGGSTGLIHNPLAFELADYWPCSSDSL